MKRASSLILMFVLGFAACAITAKWLDAQRSGRILSLGDAKVVRALQQTPNAQALPTTQLTQAASDAIESVVNIDTTEIVEAPADPFGFFSRRYRAQGAGSGVIISADGYILTNNHVVGDAQTISATLHDGRSYPAKLVGKDEESDVAVVKIDAGDLRPAKMGDSDALRVADMVLAIGNPMRLGGTVTMGIISAPKRRGFRIENTVLAEAIQTDAAINPGNSGGALVNMRGELVGINTFIMSRTGESIGLGFAIPINSARDVAAQLIKNGAVKRAWLGLRQYMGVARLAPRDLRYLDRAGWRYDGKDGVLVINVYGRSGAGRAGIQPGDVIVSLNGKNIATDEDLVLSERELRIDSTAKLGIVREGKRQTVDVKVDERPQGMEIGGGA